MYTLKYRTLILRFSLRLRGILLHGEDRGISTCCVKTKSNREKVVTCFQRNGLLYLTAKATSSCSCSSFCVLNGLKLQ